MCEPPKTASEHWRRDRRPTPHQRGACGARVNERTVTGDRNDSLGASGITPRLEPADLDRNDCIAPRRSVSPCRESSPCRAVWCLVRVGNIDVRQSSYNRREDQVESDRKDQYRADGEEARANLSDPAAQQYKSRSRSGSQRKRQVGGNQPLMIYIGEHSVRTTSSYQQLVTVQPVAPCNGEEQHRSQYREMPANPNRHMKCAAVPPQTGSERIESDRK